MTPLHKSSFQFPWTVVNTRRLSLRWHLLSASNSVDRFHRKNSDHTIPWLTRLRGTDDSPRDRVRLFARQKNLDASVLTEPVVPEEAFELTVALDLRDANARNTDIFEASLDDL